MNNSYSVTPFCHGESRAKFCHTTARRITKNIIFHFVFRILHHNKRGPGGLQCFSILYFECRLTVWIDLVFHHKKKYEKYEISKYEIFSPLKKKTRRVLTKYEALRISYRFKDFEANTKLLMSTTCTRFSPSKWI